MTIETNKAKRVIPENEDYLTFEHSLRCKLTGTRPCNDVITRIKDILTSSHVTEQPIIKVAYEHETFNVFAQGIALKLTLSQGMKSVIDRYNKTKEEHCQLGSSASEIKLRLNSEVEIQPTETKSGILSLVEHTMLHHNWKT
ncbi:hypothetical protein CR513_28574, partial [Mucuna pruriens]